MIRETLKQIAGTSAANLSPQCDFSKSIFILAHMRCGSTALSNILCSRAEISGYGEAHIRYDGEAALGRLVVNQALRRAWKPRARFLFDKILHNRHDTAAPEAFYQAQAIFVIRPPGAAVASIRKLYSDLGREEYGSDELAAQYYLERVGMMGRHWERFSPQRRLSFTHAELLSAPERVLNDISESVPISPKLENRYESQVASRRGGGGDPTTSGKYTRIEKLTSIPEADPIDKLQVPDSLRRELTVAHDEFIGMTGAMSPRDLECAGVWS